MEPTSWEALVVLLAALLPGALFVWAFERVAGRPAVGLTDRVLRFVGWSVVLQAVFAPATFSAWRYLIGSRALWEAQLSLWWWAAAVAYVVVPIGLGLLLAACVRTDSSAAQKIGLSLPPPTAWDSIFEGKPKGWVLMKLKSGGWIGGEFADGSYTGGYPEPADIYLSKELEVDQDRGDFARDAAGALQPSGYGVLVRWSEVEFLEIASED